MKVGRSVDSRINGHRITNDGFNPKRNRVCLSFVPGTKLKKAVAGLRPQNLTTAVGFKRDGDGVWLETDDGTRVADAKIRSADSTRIDFVIVKKS